MSINIKTALGLKNLSGETVTKDKIISALGYIPADPDEVEKNLAMHATNNDIHVTAIEKEQLKGIPKVSIEDNGKFMRVVDGAWQAVVIPKAEEASF